MKKHNILKINQTQTQRKGIEMITNALINKILKVLSKDKYITEIEKGSIYAALFDDDFKEEIEQLKQDMQIPDDSDLINGKQAAQLLGVSTVAIYHLGQKGYITAIRRTPKRLLYSRKEIMRMYAGLPPREEQEQQGAEMRPKEMRQTEQLPLFNDISASVEKKTQE